MVDTNIGEKLIKDINEGQLFGCLRSLALHINLCFRQKSDEKSFPDLIC